MRTIALTQGKFALIDDADFETVSQFNWHAAKRGRRFYAARGVWKSDGKWTNLLLHRFLLPGVKEIDHIDGDGLNNQRENLRPASKRQNAQASRRKAEGKTSIFRGVHWHKRDQKWHARIALYGKNRHLGYFSSEQEAARQLFGEFASPNFR